MRNVGKRNVSTGGYVQIAIALACFTTVLSLCPFFCRAQHPAERPNFIFVLVDDLRWDAMGFTGKYPFLSTPNIDRLRKEGVHFENAFVTHSLCAPSRATFLTGTFSQTHGVSTNQEGREFDPAVTPSFPAIFQKQGYQTAFIGKWHMGWTDDPREGFDYWCSFAGQGKYAGNTLNINGAHVTNAGYITDELNAYALEFLRKHANGEKPFCLYLSHKAVHGPFTPAARHRQRYADDLVAAPPNWQDDMRDKPRWQRVEATDEEKRRHRDRDMANLTVVDEREARPWNAKTGHGPQKNYLRSLLAVDDGLGRIYDFLKERNILDNTVIVFAGDNGFFHGEHGRHDKRLAYNESIRIPLVMRYPKLARPGHTISDIVLNADVAPTFLDIAGIEPDAGMQGKSMVPLLKGNHAGWRRSFLYTYWPDLNPLIPRIVAVRSKEYMYATFPDIDDIDVLYDVQRDPYELNNLAADPQYAGVRKELTAELERLKHETGYRSEVPRPDPEPDTGLREGLLLDLDLAERTPNAIEENAIRINGVKSTGAGTAACGRFDAASSVTVTYRPDLEPSAGTFIVSCLIKPSAPDGVIIAAGSEINGWALYLDQGKAGVVVAHNKRLQFADAKQEITDRWSRLVAVIDNHRNRLTLYQDGALVAERQILLPLRFVGREDGNITIGRDAGALVDAAGISQHTFQGWMKHILVYRERMSDARLRELSSQ